MSPPSRNSLLTPPSPSPTFPSPCAERWLSGRKQRFAKPSYWYKPVPRVRIPLSPPFFCAPVPHAAFASPPPDSIGPRGSNPSLWVLARGLKPLRLLHPPSLEAQLPFLDAGCSTPGDSCTTPPQTAGVEPGPPEKTPMVFSAIGGTTSASSGLVLQEVPWFSLFPAARPR